MTTHCSLSLNSIIPSQAKADTPGGETLEAEAYATTPGGDGKEGAEVTAVSEDGGLFSAPVGKALCLETCQTARRTSGSRSSHPELHPDALCWCLPVMVALWSFRKEAAIHGAQT